MSLNGLNNKTNRYNFDNICRICLRNYDLKSIKENNLIIEILQHLIGVHFETNDNLPQQICANCNEKLNDLYEFSMKCRQTYFYLLDCLNQTRNVRIKEEPIDEPEEPEKQSEVEPEIQPEPEINTENNNGDNIDDWENKRKEIEEANKKLIDDLNKISNVNIIEKTHNLIGILNPEELAENGVNSESEYEFNNKDPDSEDEESDDSSDYDSDDEGEEFPKNKKIKIAKEKVVKEKIVKEKKVKEKKVKEKKIKEKKIKEKKEKSQHECDICGRIFIFLPAFERHKANHGRLYPCDICLKSFKTQRYLRKHHRLHNDEELYKCTECGQKFRYQSNLTVHKRIHSGERPFVCSTCNEGFIEASKLKKHEYTHTGVYPFMCGVCPKGFVNKQHFKAHQMVHSAEKRFKCEKCNKGYNKTHSCKLDREKKPPKINGEEKLDNEKKASKIKGEKKPPNNIKTTPQIIKSAEFCNDSTDSD